MQNILLSFWVCLRVLYSCIQVQCVNVRTVQITGKEHVYPDYEFMIQREMFDFKQYFILLCSEQIADTILCWLTEYFYTVLVILL